MSNFDWVWASSKAPTNQAEETLPETQTDEREVHRWPSPLKTIKKLDLDYNKCGVAGAKCLAAALETNTTLEKIYMEGNEVGPQGAAYLAAALEKNQTLNTMNLGHNGIGPTGAAALAASIHASNGSLQWLNLSFNHLGKRGKPHLKVIEAKLAANTEVHWSKSGADLSSGQYKSSSLQESIDKFTAVAIL